MNLAVYHEKFIGYSNTFIYNQLVGLSDDVNAIFITHKRENELLFPFDKVSVFQLSSLEKEWNRLLPFKLSPVAAWKIEKRLRNHNTDVIHAHFGRNALKILPIAKKMKTPMVVTFHGIDASKWLKDRRYLKRLPELFDYASCICVSQEVYRALESIGCDLSGTQVHYIGVSPNSYPFIERKPISAKISDGEVVNILQVGRIVEKKGLVYLIKALRSLLDQVPAYQDFLKVQVVGGGDKGYIQSLHAIIDDLGLSDNLEWLGIKTQKELKMIYKEADVFVQHSITSTSGDKEGLPISIMEAMASGLPVISTYHSGIPELIQDEVNGYLVTERDVAGLVEKLRHVLVENQVDVVKSGRNTIEESFCLEKQTKLLEEIYRASMSGK